MRHNCGIVLDRLVIVLLGVILLVSPAAILFSEPVPQAFAHHKEGHDKGGGNGNGNNGNGNDNGNKKNKDKKDKRTDKEKYGEKSKNNILKISEKNEKKEKKTEVIDQIKPNKNKDKKTDSKISKFIKSKDPKIFAKNNGLDYHEGNTRIIINSNELTYEVLNKINAIATIEVVKNNQLQISISINDISKLESISEIKNIKSPTPPIQNKDIIIDGRIIEDSIFAKNVISSIPVSIAIIDLAFDEKNQKISDNVIENISFRHIYENSNSLNNDNNESLHGYCNG